MFAYLKLTWYTTKMSLLSSMEYRAAFISQTVGMFVNDIFLIIVWFFFFERFPSVNGWTIEDTILLFTVATVNFALVRIFAGGTEDMARHIARGNLD